VNQISSSKNEVLISSSIKSFDERKELSSARKELSSARKELPSAQRFEGALLILLSPPFSCFPHLPHSSKPYSLSLFKFDFWFLFFSVIVCHAHTHSHSFCILIIFFIQIAIVHLRLLTFWFSSSS
jgi:hypothetical protein